MGGLAGGGTPLGQGQKITSSSLVVTHPTSDSTNLEESGASLTAGETAIPAGTSVAVGNGAMATVLTQPSLATGTYLVDVGICCFNGDDTRVTSNSLAAQLIAGTATATITGQAVSEELFTLPNPNSGTAIERMLYLHAVAVITVAGTLLVQAAAFTGGYLAEGTSPEFALPNVSALRWLKIA